MLQTNTLHLHTLQVANQTLLRRPHTFEGEENTVTRISNESPRYISDTRSETSIEFAKSAEEPESGVAYHQRLTGTTYTVQMEGQCTCLESHMTVPRGDVSQIKVDFPLKESNKNAINSAVMVDPALAGRAEVSARILHPNPTAVIVSRVVCVVP